ncbi:hypothetical protein BN3087_450046 [Sulfurovum sp. enrichment culture clone C5]|uniref:Uncharacterized protein n=1 Tax=Sulfurovum sp. enrichment culture clone C5 TaxID=497650 RepID=A0A0S4XPC7_9BACT|nr:hypothetical protein BN3087_450046 [Sulfurovum sp. enrichment culture clone C5]
MIVISLNISLLSRLVQRSLLKYEGQVTMTTNHLDGKIIGHDNHCTTINIMIEYTKPYYLTFRCCSCNE